jgi:MFS family permease
VPFGISVPFFVAGALALVTVAALYFVMPESRAVTIDMHKQKASLLSTLGTVWTSLKTPLGIFFLLSMGICFALSVYEGTFSYFIMDKFGLTENPSMIAVLNGTMQSTGPTVMAILFTVMGIVSVLCQGVLVGATIKRLGEEKTTIVGLLLASVGLVLVLVSPELVTMIISACLIGIGSGLVNPSISSLVSRRTDSEKQGSTLGVLGSYNSLGRIVGPPAGGWVYDMNLYMPYISSAILLVMGAVAVIFISRGKKREEDQARVLIHESS